MDNQDNRTFNNIVRHDTKALRRRIGGNIYHYLSFARRTAIIA